jgi:TolB-like protein/DNA-binding winged helix-turn-helix (wHTH) protein
MLQTDLSRRNLKFGVFEADIRTGELTKLGRRVRLQEQPFQLLAMLLERPGELVTREQLHLKLWPETTVDFDHGLNKAISKIRDALGDSAENPRFIETVARRGYRFLADVTVIDAAPTRIVTGDLAALQNPDPPSFDPPGLSDADTPPRGKLHSLPWLRFGIAPVLAIALLAILYPWRHPPPVIHSIVVLPLQNLSGDPSQDSFADGMTDQLVTDLTQIRRLRVISSTMALGYKGTGQPLGQIARDLNIDAVMKGSVVFSGGRVRINARLIDVPTGSEIWAQSYEADSNDKLKLQNETARAIAEQFRSILNRQERARLDGTVDNPDGCEGLYRTAGCFRQDQG